MRKITAPADRSRRQFAAGLCTVFVVSLSSGSMALARGGGGDVRRDREEQRQRAAREKTKNSASITQAQFLQFSRTKHFEYSQSASHHVEGFSAEMSVALFRMGYSNLSRANALVERLMKTPQVQARRDILRKEVALAREEFDGSWGFSSQKQKRKTYLDAVSVWAGNPREGRLPAR